MNHKSQYITLNQNFNEWQQHYTVNIPDYSDVIDINIVNKSLTILIKKNKEINTHNKQLLITLLKENVNDITDYQYFKCLTIQEPNTNIINNNTIHFDIINKYYYTFIQIIPSAEEIRDTKINNIVE